MRTVARLRQEPLTAFGLPVLGGAIVPTVGQHWWVDAYAAVHTPKYAFGHGRSQDYPLSTFAAAESASQTGDVILIHGKVFEEATMSNLKFDRKVVGIGGQHHGDQPTSSYHPGASAFRPPSSPTATTALVTVRGRGTEFHNLMFDCPVDDAGIDLIRNALSDVSEYDASHAIISNCRFTDGLIAVKNDGGASFVRISNSRFQRMSGSGAAAIKCTSTGVAVPLNWVIETSDFHNNASHILSSMSYSSIKDNIFGRFTATLSIDIDDQPSANQGEYNVITRNYLSGTYSATAYPPGSNNEWGGNYNSLSGGVTAADPV